MLANPYRGRPDYTYWRQGVAALSWDEVDPVVDVPFTIARRDRVATAGSCFAQHLSRTLQQDGFSYLVTETFADQPGTADESYSVFTARFGNVYTTKQLLQLFDRPYGLYRPHDRWFTARCGGVIDPFRPRIQTGGYPTPELLERDRVRHFAAVRRMFEHCDVFIFTLGLTEHLRVSIAKEYAPPPDTFDALLTAANAARDAALAQRDTAIAERDAAIAELSRIKNEAEMLAAESRRWFEAVIAVSNDHNPLLRRPRKRTRANRLANDGRPSPLFRAARARDAANWEIAVRYYRDALDVEPDDPAIWAELAAALQNAGKTAEAALAERISRDVARRMAGHDISHRLAAAKPS